MRVKKKRKFQRGGGVLTNPSGTEIPSGWGLKTKKPSVGGGGMDIFWNCTIHAYNTCMQCSLISELHCMYTPKDACIKEIS